MSIFKRVRDIIDAKINELLDEFEDPIEMANPMIRQMERTIVEMRKNVAAAAWQATFVPGLVLPAGNTPANRRFSSRDAFPSPKRSRHRPGHGAVSDPVSAI